MFTTLDPRPDLRNVGRAPKSLLIEGWRGINHSFALASQQQILGLLKLGTFDLFHRNLPFAFRHWSRAVNGSGLPASDMSLIDALQDPADRPVDCVYRVVAPFRPGIPIVGRKTVTFMITELGLSRNSFEAGQERSPIFTRDDNRIVTSTAWSRDRIVEWGFADAKVSVIPLGVDTSAFRPVDGVTRAQNRAALGIAEDEFVFVNIGMPAWNKGIDLLLIAFATIRSQGHRARLILKDQRDVYGVSVEQSIRVAGEKCPELFHHDTMAAISVIPGNMTRAQLCLLYGVADCYVSPYRAEGFNLPVLEAIACALPVIVTAGGATDDFCSDDVAIRIHGRWVRYEDPASGCLGAYVEPDLGDLIAAMGSLASGSGSAARSIDSARATLLGRFSWERAAVQLAKLTVGYEPPDAVGTDPGQTVGSIDLGSRSICQQDVLSLLDRIRPWSMACGQKVRIGNDHDGGYVVPAAAFVCDAVLSIGVGSDVSFDLELADLGAEILQFDHTVDAPPVHHARFSFNKLGWGAAPHAPFVSLQSMVARLSALGAKRPLLKFDIEGGEYDVLEHLDPAELAVFDVIVCEIHNLDRLADIAFHRRVRKSFDVLTRHHVAVHLHANNYRGISLIAGVPVPEVLEISFLRRDLDTFPARSNEPIPGPLDRPNHPHRPDILLTVF